jgi:pimeloyl-ACP methyl ester carboxylesterase
LTPFAQHLARLFPQWKFVLPDLPCHGHSAHLIGPSNCLHGDTSMGAPTVRSCSAGVWEIMDFTGMTPNVIIGHSFGGKVCLMFYY